MQKTTHLVCALTATFTIASALVGEVQAATVWGSQAYVTTGIRVFGPGSSVSTAHDGSPTVGDVGSPSASNTFADSRGVTEGHVELTSGSGITVPIIRTYARTLDGEYYARGAAFAMEGYTYSGTSPATFTLSVNLSGTFSAMDNDFAGNFANLSIWSASSFFGDIYFSSDISGYSELGLIQHDSLSLEQNGLEGDDVLSGTLTWTMNPGETVYLHAAGLSRAYGPNSEANALSTLTMSFDDSTGLTAASVPEPNTVLAGGLGIFFLLLLRPRR